MKGEKFLNKIAEVLSRFEQQDYQTWNRRYKILYLKRYSRQIEEAFRQKEIELYEMVSLFSIHYMKMSDIVGIDVFDDKDAPQVMFPTKITDEDLEMPDIFKDNIIEFILNTQKYIQYNATHAVGGVSLQACINGMNEILTTLGYVPETEKQSQLIRK